MYTAMSKSSDSYIIDRGIALHKMIRLVTMSLSGEGYLNFMGNEFGHPEWIDFPREGNGWSHFYCRRQWHLVDDKGLRYRDLFEFDREMLSLAKKRHIFAKKPKVLFVDEEKKVMGYERGGVTFVFNFHPTAPYNDYYVKTSSSGKYRVVLSTDESKFGGWDRVSTDYVYEAKRKKGESGFSIYLPPRCAMCLVKVK